MVTRTVSEKKLSESCVDLNGELEKGAVGPLEALRTLERKLQDINEASLRKVNFYSDQNRPSLQKKKTQCNCITTDVKKPES